MKAVTVPQPWAQLIAHGHKQVLTQAWPTAHRGALAVHAAHTPPHTGIDDVIHSGGFAALDPHTQHALLMALETSRYPLGAIIATCTLTDVQRLPMPGQPAAGTLEYALGDYDPGMYAWIITDAELVEPVAVRGESGLWDVVAETPQHVLGTP